MTTKVNQIDQEIAQLQSALNGMKTTIKDTPPSHTFLAAVDPKTGEEILDAIPVELDLDEPMQQTLITLGTDEAVRLYGDIQILQSTLDASINANMLLDHTHSTTYMTTASRLCDEFMSLKQEVPPTAMDFLFSRLMYLINSFKSLQMDLRVEERPPTPP